MEHLHNIALLIGAGSLALLWAFAAIGGLASLWDTFGGHLEGLVERIKGKG